MIEFLEEMIRHVEVLQKSEPSADTRALLDYIKRMRDLEIDRRRGREIAPDGRSYAVVLEPDEEGGFTVRVPAFPEIVTYGGDEHEAMTMAEDAVRLVIEDSIARGEPIPAGEPPRIREITVIPAA